MEEKTMDSKSKIRRRDVLGFRSVAVSLWILLVLILISIIILAIYGKEATTPSDDGEGLGVANYLCMVFFPVGLFAALFEFGFMYYFFNPVSPFINQEGLIKKLRIISIDYSPTKEVMERMSAAIAKDGRKARFDNRMVFIKAKDEESGKEYDVIGMFIVKRDVKKMKVGDLWSCFVCDAVKDSVVALKKPTFMKEDRPTE